MSLLEMNEGGNRNSAGGCLFAIWSLRSVRSGEVPIPKTACRDPQELIELRVPLEEFLLVARVLVLLGLLRLLVLVQADSSRERPSLRRTALWSFRSP
jgi:hypothetical protein